MTDYPKPNERDPGRRGQTEGPHLRFRWELVIVPIVALLLIAAFEFLAQSGPRWDDVLGVLGVQNRQRYTALAALGIVLIAALLIVKEMSRSNRR